jgi:two-component system, cell cycle sensor histidine kinase and response regulator CckA
MNARDRKPSPGEEDLPARDPERDSAEESEDLRRRLAEVSSHLAESELGRHEAEARLSNPDGQFAACLDGLMDGVLINSSIRDETGRIVDFRIVYSNEAASRISGVAHEDLVGHRILDLFPGRRENGQFDAYVRVVETGEPLVRASIKDHDVPDRSDPVGFGRDFEVSVTRFGDGYIATLHDIVARRRAEESVFRAQQMLRLVLDTIPQRVFWKDTNSVFVGCNAAHARDAGLADSAEIVGKTDHELPWGEQADEYAIVEKAVLASGEPRLGFEESQVRADGKVGWNRVSKVPLFDGEGRVVGILGTYEDITERRNSEEALRESERFLTDILENIPVMVFVKNASDLRFARVNRAAELALGYTREQLVGQEDQGLAPADESAFFASVERQVLETGQAIDVPEEFLTTPHQGRRVFHTTKMPIFDEQGRPRYVLGISNDITDLKVAEEARRESEERYRRIIDTITDYVMSVKIEKGQAISASHGPGCVAVTGYAAEELSGDPDLWFRLVVTEDREVATDQVRRILAGERTGPLEYRILRKDGAVRWVRHTPVVRLDADGEPVAYDGVIQDITERRVLEEQLLQSQKMEGIGRLAGGVAHDFNNLLTAILGYVEMCKFDLPPELPDDHPARLDLLEVGMAGERAAGLTRQLLAFASRQIVAPVRLNLSALVGDSVKMLERLLGDDIEIETALDPGVGTVEADPVQIQQLLVNLTVNASDAMSEGGRLLIETADETIDEESARTHPGAVPGPYVLLAVTDTGMGMTEEVRAHLFEPFFTTKGLGKGTGLGLAMCHGIVRQMHGHIRVYSEPGHGTTFRIYLPRHHGAVERRPVPVAPRSVPTGVETVLVVEDEPHVRRLAVLGLRAHGYVVLEAADGAEALQIAGRVGSALDVIVSDVMMPGMKGPELLKRLSAIAPRARALLMSGHAESTVLSQRTASRIAFLPKPFTPERLARKVRDLLDGPNSD